MKWYVSGFLFVALSLSNTIHASQFIKITDQQLVQKAKHIVTGTVTKITNVLENEIPFQYIEVTISTVHKSNPEAELFEGDVITIKQMGGEAEGISLDIDGLPKFQENTEVFLTLKEGLNNYFIVVGNEQGKFDVVNSDELIRDTAQSVFVLKGEDGRIEFHPGTVEITSLKTILNKIKKIPVNGRTDIQE